MKAVEFIAALNTVEQDHRMVLEKMQALKETVKFLLDPKHMNLQLALKQLEDSYNFFSTEFSIHMEEEETTLFPLIERYRMGGGEQVADFRKDHDEIRRKLEEFGNCLTVASELQEKLPRTVLMDLLVYAWDLWQVLDRHAHEETEGLHKCLTESLRGGGFLKENN